jgi:hypothetical protein
MKNSPISLIKFQGKINKYVEVQKQIHDFLKYFTQ